MPVLRTARENSIAKRILALHTSREVEAMRVLALSTLRLIAGHSALYTGTSEVMQVKVRKTGRFFGLRQ